MPALPRRSNREQARSHNNRYLRLLLPNNDPSSPRTSCRPIWFAAWRAMDCKALPAVVPKKSPA